MCDKVMTSEEAKKEAQRRNKAGEKPADRRYWTVRMILIEAGVIPPPSPKSVSTKSTKAPVKPSRPKTEPHPPMNSFEEDRDEI